MSDDEALYAQLRQVAAVCHSASDDMRRHCDEALRRELPDWLEARFDDALLALTNVVKDTGRFIREDRQRPDSPA